MLTLTLRKIHFICINFMLIKPFSDTSYAVGEGIVIVETVPIRIELLCFDLWASGPFSCWEISPTCKAGYNFINLFRFFFHLSHICSTYKYLGWLWRDMQCHM